MEALADSSAIEAELEAVSRGERSDGGADPESGRRERHSET